MQLELARIWQEREQEQSTRDPSFKQIPLFFVQKPSASVGSQSRLVQQETGKFGRVRLLILHNFL